LGRAAPTRILRDDGRHCPMHADAAPEGRTLIANGWRMVKRQPCLQRADEGHTIVNALGRTSYTPQPQGPPEGFRNPAQSAPESPCPGRGSHGRGGAGVRPQEISRSARAPRRRFLEGAADVDRGRSREAPRGVARVAPGSREKLAGARLHEDGGRARADRAGNRAPAAAANEIARRAWVTMRESSGRIDNLPPAWAYCSALRRASP
jgi:hypothetical protein